MNRRVFLKTGIGAGAAAIGSKKDAVGFLMYPQAETGEGRKDSLDPDAFKYKMTSRELGA